MMQKNDQANLRRAYGRTIRLCTEEIRAKLKVKDRYKNITPSGEVIGLLKLIKHWSYSYILIINSLKLCTSPSASSTTHLKKIPPHA